MKKNWLSIVAFASLFLVGCSDYPSTGVVDTRVIRELVNIEGITGKAYGLKETAQGAIVALDKDAELLKRAKYDIWEHMIEKGNLDQLNLALSYPSVDGSAMASMLENISSHIDAIYTETLGAIETEKSNTKQALDAATADLAKRQAADTSFKKATEAEQNDYDKAAQELSKAKQEVRETYQTAATSMSKLAERLGYKGLRSLSYDEDLIGRYRTLDYTGKSNLPADCPPQRGYETVDTRDLSKTCSYLHIGTIFMSDSQIEREARKILNTNFRALAEIIHTIGKDGSDATGLIANVAERETALNAAYAEAAKSFGDKRKREVATAELNRKIEALSAKLTTLNTDEFQQEELYDVDVSYPEGYSAALTAYMEVMRNDLFSNHVVELSDMKLDSDADNRDGHFENVGSGFVGIATVTDILTSRSRSTKVLRSYGFADLTDPKTADADQINVQMSRDSIKRRSRKDSQEKMEEGLISYLSDIYAGA